MKLIVMALFIISFFNACETGYKGECTTEPITETESTSNNKPEPYEPKAEYIEEGLAVQTFEGGRVSDGLDIGTIRVSQESNSLRLVFDSYMWNHDSEHLGEKVTSSGSYTFTYDPSKRLITAVIQGYRGFSADMPKFSSSSLVEKIYFDNYLDDSGYKFHIKLRDDATVKVFDLSNPGRIVVDIKLF
ncbi:MAG: AMIN domain-containing protein [Epsilonproteobacteria bacterium]|nr:AMIN domain-containing protein [Campylobacterota bacterium]